MYVPNIHPRVPDVTSSIPVTGALVFRKGVPDSAHAFNIRRNCRLGDLQNKDWFVANKDVADHITVVCHNAAELRKLLLVRRLVVLDPHAEHDFHTRFARKLQRSHCARLAEDGVRPDALRVAPDDVEVGADLLIRKAQRIAVCFRPRCASLVVTESKGAEANAVQIHNIRVRLRATATACRRWRRRRRATAITRSTGVTEQSPVILACRSLGAIAARLQEKEKDTKLTIFG